MKKFLTVGINAMLLVLTIATLASCVDRKARHQEMLENVQVDELNVLQYLEVGDLVFEPILGVGIVSKVHIDDPSDSSPKTSTPTYKKVGMFVTFINQNSEDHTGDLVEDLFNSNTFKVYFYSNGYSHMNTFRIQPNRHTYEWSGESDGEAMPNITVLNRLNNMNKEE